MNSVYPGARRRGPPHRPEPGKRLLALVTLMIVLAAGACTTTSGPGVARSAAPSIALTDDPEADTPFLRGEWEEAVRLHRVLVEKEPGNGRAYYHLGYAWGQLGKFAEEIAAYREAVRLGVREGPLYYNLGIALATASEDYDGAIAAFQEGLRLTPDDPQLWYNLGTAYMSKGDFPRARDAFQAALQGDPDHVDALNNLAHALIGLGDLAGARAAWQEILAMDPGNLAAQMNLRSLDEKEGRGPGSNGRNPDLRQ
ncbi:MAG: tetratricopeptide repeat protein, partial [Candidatus Methylomirabilales bacterium]